MRVACILEEFLRGFSASLRVGEVFDKAWEVLGENNYFQISLLEILSLSAEQCSQLIASPKNNSRKLEGFLEIARACGVSRHKNKPLGVQLFFTPSSDGEKQFRQLFAEHFSDDMAIYPYAAIIKIPDADFTKMRQVLKTLEPKNHESKMPLSKPVSKGSRANQIAMNLFAGIYERRRAGACRPPAEDSSNELDNGGSLTV